MGFDVKATRAWWDFFHRFSLVYTGSNFDYIVVLGLNLLQCGECQEDGNKFYKTIGSHKTPFEKIYILHNYVNRKLKKPIIEIADCKKYANDILFENNGKANWLFLSRYYFSLLFSMTKYLEDKQLKDLKEFSAYIYQGFASPKKLNSLAINTAGQTEKKIDRELLQLQIYEYYQKFNQSLGFSKHGKAYRDVYGSVPKKTRICKSCAKKHQLYLEQHNQAKGVDEALPLVQNRNLVRKEIAKINREIIKEKTKLVKLEEVQPGSIPVIEKSITKSPPPKSPPKPPSIAKMRIEQNRDRILPTKKPRDRQKYITDQRVVASMSITKTEIVNNTRAVNVKYHSVVKKKARVKMNSPTVNIKIKKPSGGTVRKKVISIDKSERPKRLITYKRSRKVRYKRRIVASKS